jgi:hypothetical protein
MFTEEVRDGQAAERRESALIWVVDRDSDLLRFLKTSLVRSMGSEVRLLQSGGEALGALARSRPERPERLPSEPKRNSTKRGCSGCSSSPSRAVGE